MEEKTKNINIATEEFKQNLTKIIRDCGLPIANIYLVCKLLTNEIEQMYYALVNTKEENNLSKQEEKEKQ